MFEVGRVVVKTAGRDARKKGVIIEVLDKTYVLIDGESRRRKCNISHIEPLDKVLNIEKSASHDAVVEAFKKELNIDISEKKTKEKTIRPYKVKKVKETNSDENVKTAPVKKAPAKKAKAEEKPKKVSKASKKE
ncbi:MAG: 50S ribosomal protein L14e [archaeon]